MATAQAKTETGARRPTAKVVTDARRLASDASAMADDARRLSADLRRMITENPLQAVGVAIGAGFVVAGGLSPAILRSLTGLAGRLAMVVITKRAVEMLDQRGGGSSGSHATSPRRSTARPNSSSRK